jgi:hypothetical protein
MPVPDTGTAGRVVRAYPAASTPECWPCRRGNSVVSTWSRTRPLMTSRAPRAEPPTKQTGLTMSLREGAPAPDPQCAAESASQSRWAYSVCSTRAGSNWGLMASSLVGRRREALLLAAGPALGAAVGAVTNLVTSTWNWWLFGALLVLISLASAGAALVPGSGSGGIGSSYQDPPCTLPPGAAVFAGRDRELRRLLKARPRRRGSRPLVCAITGRSGSGKTELAVQAAHRLTDRYPAGQLFVSYRSHAVSAGRLDPLDALAALLVAVSAAQTPASLGPAGMSGQWQSVVGH